MLESHGLLQPVPHRTAIVRPLSDRRFRHPRPLVDAKDTATQRICNIVAVVAFAAATNVLYSYILSCK